MRLGPFVNLHVAICITASENALIEVVTTYIIAFRLELPIDT